MKKKNLYIECPCCGREYLPCEIYLPDSFLGKTKTIIRKNSGKIDTFFGKNMDLKETYVCDKCNSKFSVFAKVSFYTNEIKDEFDEEFVSKINKKITLEED